MKKNGFSPVIILILVVIVLVAGYLLLPANIKTALIPKIAITQNSLQATTTPEQSSLFTGKLTRLSQDLKLFKITEDMQLNGVTAGFVYYSAGQFTRGNLAGYTRIIATEPQQGPNPPPVYILATKDFKTYILDDPNNLTKFSIDDFRNPYTFIDKTKITSAAKFDTDQPSVISLNNQFSLYSNMISTISMTSGFKDKYDQFIQETDIASDLSSPLTASSFQKLTSPVGNITMYYLYNNNGGDNKAIIGDTKVFVVDSTGLPIVYSLTTPKNIADYQVKEQQHDAAMQKFYNKETTVYPDYVYTPHLGFNSSDITNRSISNFYKDYEVAFPEACANDLDTMLVNISTDDLVQVGTINGVTVFGLKDQNSDLNTQEYSAKMGGWGSGPDFSQFNPGMPTNLGDYVKNNPLLFIKDYWGRWAAVGEWDVKLAGGCGKPVIYLYPQKDTTVTVKFNAPVSFTTDIPNYGDYWQVLAHTDGTLTNLRSNLTDCSKFDGLTFGSEYAKEACLTNTYPYLYWSGNITSTTYPKATGGWVVAKTDLASFIDSKLSYMGLNTKEKSDFESYWIPEMLGKDSSFYRVSFFNTQQVNQLFPMTVTPTPDSVFRIFMDWQPLAQKPETLPTPQNLEQLVRRGFTMVEWGGLK